LDHAASFGGGTAHAVHVCAFGRHAVRWKHDDVVDPAKFDVMNLLDQVEKEGVDSEEAALDRLKELIDEQHKKMTEEIAPLVEGRLYKEYDKHVDAEIKKMDQEYDVRQWLSGSELTWCRFIESDIVWSSQAIQAFHAKRVEKVEEIRQSYTQKLVNAEYWPSYLSDERIAKAMALEKSEKKRKELKRNAVKFNWVLKRQALTLVTPSMPVAPASDAGTEERIQYQLAKQHFKEVGKTFPKFDEGPFQLVNNICLRGARSDEFLTREVLLGPLKPVRKTRAKLDRTIVKQMRDDIKQIQ